MTTAFDQYYLRQASGAGLPVFAGASIQRGHGLGNILNSAFRAFMPALKSAGKALLHQGLQTGAHVLDDVISGQNVEKAAKRRVREGGQQLLHRALEAPSPPKRAKKRGVASKKSQSRPKSRRQRQQQQQPKDIFS